MTSYEVPGYISMWEEAWVVHTTLRGKVLDNS